MGVTTEPFEAPLNSLAPPVKVSRPLNKPGLREIVADADPALASETETVAVWALGIDPVAIVNGTDVAPAAAVTDEGAVRSGELLAIDNVAPVAGAGSERAIVQTVLAFDDKLAAAQFRELTLITGTIVRLVFAEDEPETAPIEAVSVTVLLCETGVALTPKLLVAEPAGIETDAGAVRPGEPAASVTVVAAAAAPFNVTTHVLEAPEFKDAGLQASELSAGETGLTEAATAPPVAEIAIASPVREAPSAFVTCIDAEGVAEASVTPTTATTPFGMVVELMPYKTQVYAPDTEAQEIDLPAETEAGPVVAASAAMPDAG